MSTETNLKVEFNIEGDSESQKHFFNSPEEETQYLQSQQRFAQIEETLGINPKKIVKELQNIFSNSPHFDSLKHFNEADEGNSLNIGLIKMILQAYDQTEDLETNQFNGSTNLSSLLRSQISMIKKRQENFFKELEKEFKSHSRELERDHQKSIRELEKLAKKIIKGLSKELNNFVLKKILKKVGKDGYKEFQKCLKEATKEVKRNPILKKNYKKALNDLVRNLEKEGKNIVKDFERSYEDGLNRNIKKDVEEFIKRKIQPAFQKHLKAIKNKFRRSKKDLESSHKKHIRQVKRDSRRFNNVLKKKNKEILKSNSKSKSTNSSRMTKKVSRLMKKKISDLVEEGVLIGNETSERIQPIMVQILNSIKRESLAQGKGSNDHELMNFYFSEEEMKNLQEENIFSIKNKISTDFLKDVLKSPKLRIEIIKNFETISSENENRRPIDLMIFLSQMLEEEELKIGSEEEIFGTLTCIGGKIWNDQEILLPSPKNIFEKNLRKLKSRIAVAFMNNMQRKGLFSNNKTNFEKEIENLKNSKIDEPTLENFFDFVKSEKISEKENFEEILQDLEENYLSEKNILNVEEKVKSFLQLIQRQNIDSEHIIKLNESLTKIEQIEDKLNKIKSHLNLEAEEEEKISQENFDAELEDEISHQEIIEKKVEKKEPTPEEIKRMKQELELKLKAEKEREERRKKEEVQRNLRFFLNDLLDETRGKIDKINGHSIPLIAVQDLEREFYKKNKGELSKELNMEQKRVEFLKFYNLNKKKIENIFSPYDPWNVSYIKSLFISQKLRKCFLDTVDQESYIRKKRQEMKEVILSYAEAVKKDNILDENEVKQYLNKIDISEWEGDQPKIPELNHRIGDSFLGMRTLLFNSMNEMLEMNKCSDSESMEETYQVIVRFQDEVKKIKTDFKNNPEKFEGIESVYEYLNSIELPHNQGNFFDIIEAVENKFNLDVERIDGGKLEQIYNLGYSDGIMMNHLRFMDGVLSSLEEGENLLLRVIDLASQNKKRGSKIQVGKKKIEEIIEKEDPKIDEDKPEKVISRKDFYSIIQPAMKITEEINYPRVMVQFFNELERELKDKENIVERIDLVKYFAKENLLEDQDFSEEKIIFWLKNLYENPPTHQPSFIKIIFSFPKLRRLFFKKIKIFLKTREEKLRKILEETFSEIEKKGKFNGDISLEEAKMEIERNFKISNWNPNDDNWEFPGLDPDLLDDFDELKQDILTSINELFLSNSCDSCQIAQTNFHVKTRFLEIFKQLKKINEKDTQGFQNIYKYFKKKNFPEINFPKILEKLKRDFMDTDFAVEEERIEILNKISGSGYDFELFEKLINLLSKLEEIEKDFKQIVFYLEGEELITTSVNGDQGYEAWKYIEKEKMNIKIYLSTKIINMGKI